MFRKSIGVSFTSNSDLAFTRHYLISTCSLSTPPEVHNQWNSRKKGFLTVSGPFDAVLWSVKSVRDLFHCMDELLFFSIRIPIILVKFRLELSFLVNHINIQGISSKLFNELVSLLTLIWSQPQPIFIYDKDILIPKLIKEILNSSWSTLGVLVSTTPCQPSLSLDTRNSCCRSRKHPLQPSLFTLDTRLQKPRKM